MNVEPFVVPGATPWQRNDLQPEPPPGKRVTVIIPAFNEADCLGRTLESILAQTWQIKEIIVVDDGSNDKTGQVACQFGATVIRIERDEHNCKARSLNLALGLKSTLVPRVKTEFTVTVDADTILAPNAIEKCLPVFEDPRVACASGTVIPQVRETLFELARFIEYMQAFSLPKPAQAAIGCILVSPGCFTVHRTRCLEELGGYNIRTKAEDMDYTLSCLERGWLAVHVPEAICFPIEPPDLIRYIKQRSRWARGTLQCMKERKWKLRKIAGPGFGLLLWFYLIAPLTNPILIASLVYHSGNVRDFFLTIAVVQACSVWPFALWRAWKVGHLGIGLISLPAPLVVVYIDLAVYLYAIGKEVILKQTLSHWDKGH